MYIARLIRIFKIKPIKYFFKKVHFRFFRQTQPLEYQGRN